MDGMDPDETRLAMWHSLIPAIPWSCPYRPYRPFLSWILSSQFV